MEKYRCRLAPAAPSSTALHWGTRARVWVCPQLRGSRFATGAPGRSGAARGRPAPTAPTPARTDRGVPAGRFGQGCYFGGAPRDEPQSGGRLRCGAAVVWVTPALLCAVREAAEALRGAGGGRAAGVTWARNGRAAALARRLRRLRFGAPCRRRAARTLPPLPSCAAAPGPLPGKGGTPGGLRPRGDPCRTVRWETGYVDDGRDAGRPLAEPSMGEGEVASRSMRVAACAYRCLLVHCDLGWEWSILTFWVIIMPLKGRLFLVTGSKVKVGFSPFPPSAPSSDFWGKNLVDKG